MPLFVLVLAPGFVSDPDKFDLAVFLTRIAFPYLALVSLVAFYSGALNARGRFAAAAFAPALLNVVFILALVLVFRLGYADSPRAGVVLAWATLVGGVAQLAVVFFAAAHDGMVFRLRRPDYSDEELTSCAQRIVQRASGWQDAFIYFKHEAAGRGPVLAARLRALMDEGQPAATAEAS